MKEIMAQDSQRLVVMDDKVKHRGLFSYYLPRVIASIALSGLTVYGLLQILF